MNTHLGIMFRVEFASLRHLPENIISHLT